MPNLDQPTAATPLPPIGDETIFTPSDKQRQFLDLLLSQRDPASIRHLCSLGVVSRGTLYRWQQDPTFNRWLGSHSLAHIFTHSAMLLTTSFNSALNGNSRLAEILLKFTTNPKGLPALAQFLATPPPAVAATADSATIPPLTATSEWGERRAERGATREADRAHPDLHEEDEEGRATGNEALPGLSPHPPLPASTGAISATFRALRQLDGLVADSDLAQAKRTRQFAEEMEKLHFLVAREERLRREENPPGIFAPVSPLVPGNPEVESLERMRWDDFARRIPGNICGQISAMQLRQLQAECRADLIAAKAGHVCRMAETQPPAVTLECTAANFRTFRFKIEEDTVPEGCDFPDPAPGPHGKPPTCLEFLQAFRTGDLATARRGLAAGIPIHLRSTNNLTPFSIAVRAGQIEMFEFAVRAAALPPGQVPDFPYEPVHPEPR